MVNKHGMEKPYKCELCGKTFYLKWRLNKHASNHSGPSKPCKYSEEGNICPFAEVGCKFQHNDTDTKDDEQDAGPDTEPDADCDEPVHSCNFCDTNFLTQGDLIVHIGNEHLDHFPHIQQDDLLMVF